MTTLRNEPTMAPKQKTATLIKNKFIFCLISFNQPTPWEKFKTTKIPIKKIKIDIENNFSFVDSTMHLNAKKSTILFDKNPDIWYFKSNSGETIAKEMLIAKTTKAIGFFKRLSKVFKKRNFTEINKARITNIWFDQNPTE